MMDESAGICGISLKQLRFLQIIENMLDSGLEEFVDVYVWVQGTMSLRVQGRGEM